MRELTNEFATELTVLGTVVRTRAQARLAANKANDLRDPDVYETLRDAEGHRSDGELLEAITTERKAYEQCVAIVIQEML